MVNNFLDKNYLINEKISNFKGNPCSETFTEVLKQVYERMKEDGHFLIPVWTHEEEKDKEPPTFCFHQLQTNDGQIYLVAFTDEDEVHKGQSTGILSDFIDQFFDFVFAADYAAGFILNPWGDNDLIFSKALMQIITDKIDQEEDPLKANENLNKALHFAVDRHAGAVRKGTNRPYIGHPLEVMNILNQMEADTNLMIAGLLHDTLEDTETTYMEIKNEFGMDVAALVASHTKNPNLSWEEVRKHKIEEMDESSFRVKLLIMADMTANLRSLWRDYRHLGDELWNRFNAPKDKQAWYYGTMQDKFYEMQNYMETAETYWEMVGLFKDLFVEFYLNSEEDKIYQACADGTCYVFTKGGAEWLPGELTEDLTQINRHAAERLEDHWREDI